ncbi:uncharacterized protein LOC114541020 [Dendronephthya gigantea]|uniref:uncharacterized protein LOC114541020 n=1 Tax=Dendronephthya gigantea TaxID=151771 RepID=UPI00106B18F0|nr:uncharacterized protein LOC114541020 [Dendronephthya gigantea]
MSEDDSSTNTEGNTLQNDNDLFNFRDIFPDDFPDDSAIFTPDFFCQSLVPLHNVLEVPLLHSENLNFEDETFSNTYNVVAELLEEIPEDILLSTENLLGTMEETDQIFHENLTTMSAESNMNSRSFHTEPTTDNIASEPSTGTLERINRFGFAMGTTNSDAFAISCNINQFDTAADHLTMESSLQNNAISPPSLAYEYTHGVVPEISHPLVILNPNSRKRPFEEDIDPGQAVIPAFKKRLEEPCCSSDVASFVNEKTIPAGAASSEGKERRSVATTQRRTCVREPAEEAALNEQKNEAAIEYLKAWVRTLFEENESLIKDRETHMGDISEKKKSREKKKSLPELQEEKVELKKENTELRNKVKTMSSEAESLMKRLHISSEVSVIATKIN